MCIRAGAWPLARPIAPSRVFTVAFVLVPAGYSVWRLARDYRINLDREVASRREAWQARGPLVP